MAVTRVSVALSNAVRLYMCSKDSEGHWEGLIFHLIHFTSSLKWNLLLLRVYNSCLWKTIECHVFKGPSIPSAYTTNNGDTQAALQSLS